MWSQTPPAVQAVLTFDMQHYSYRLLLDEFTGSTQADWDEQHSRPQSRLTTAQVKAGLGGY